jgi:hypothetical protein
MLEAHTLLTAAFTGLSDLLLKTLPFCFVHTLEHIPDFVLTSLVKCVLTHLCSQSGLPVSERHIPAVRISPLLYVTEVIHHSY